MLPDAEAAFLALRLQIANAPVRKRQLVGIHSGGVWVAQRLADELGINGPIGEVDIAYYRDDFGSIGLHTSNRPTHLPFDVESAHILLVDDVLFTGRTTRGALNVLFDYGRPGNVELAALFDRGGRELPIAPDFCGAQVDVSRNETLVLRSAAGRFTTSLETLAPNSYA